MLSQIILSVIATAAVSIPIAFLIGDRFRKSKVERTIGSAEEQAKKIADSAEKQSREAAILVEDAKRTVAEAERVADEKRKEAVLAAKEEVYNLKTEAEREIKENRAEVTRLERRAIAKEEALDRKIEAHDRKEEALERKHADADKRLKTIEEKTAEVERIKEEQLVKLEEISGYTTERAKQEILLAVETEVRHEAAQRIIEIESQLKEEADDRARNIIALAIQRCAAEHSTESTVSVVALPSDDMKGRIIGREGRNIRSIETATGVDLIIDDTPEAITVSCFDPVRREIARLALEKLIADGRIHPARIEEMVDKAKKEVETLIRQAGEKAVFETGVRGVPPELIRLLGRLQYRTSYGQNVLQHSVEVAYLAGIMADELGIDSTLAKRAGLLHDIGKSMTQEIEGSHVQLGVDIARKFKENPEVIHAIEAHHNDVEPHTITAILVQAADAVSAARPGARREDLEAYIKRLEKLEEISAGFPGVEKTFAIQAGREIRIMVKPEEVSDAQMVLTARDIVKKIEEELEYPGQIKINVIRENRVVEYAK
ncbi:MAG: ribonuclease Y [Eubacteriales bacterium]|jgi:ribonuclease Y